MQFISKFKFNIILLFCILLQLFALNIAQASKLDEIDAIRADLACQKDKKSQEYIKTKQKLGKLIIQNKMNYSTAARFQDIERLINEKKYNSAIYELNDLIDNNIEISKCNELLGDICLRTSKSSKTAAKYYKNAIEYDNNNDKALFKLAKLYFLEQKNILGTELLKKLVDKINDEVLLTQIVQFIQNDTKPNNKYEANNLYELLGLIYDKLNKKIEAYGAFDKALQLNPKDIYLQYYFGDLLFENNQNNGALIIYNSILKENPFESQIRTSKAKTLAKDGNILSASKEYSKILEQYPNSNQAKYGLFKIYENKLPANKILEKIYENIPNYKVTVEECAKFSQFLKEMNDYQGAQIFDYYIKCLEEEKIKQAQFQKEVEQNSNKKLNQKTKETAKTIKKPQKEKRKPIIKTNGKNQGYEKILEEYLSIENKDANTYIAIANTYKLLNEPQSAIEYYKEALKLSPQNSDIYYSLGLIYMELNSTKTAKTYLEQAISLNSENIKAKNLLSFINQKIVTSIINNAYSSFENKQYIEALEILNNGIKEYPSNAQLYYYRALVCDAMDRNAAQIIDLQKAIELDPSHYMSFYQLGLAYEKIRDERSALVAYERFLSIEPDEKELVKEVQKKVLALGAKYY